MLKLERAKEEILTVAIGTLAILIFWGDIVFGFHYLYDLDIHTEFLPLQKFLQFSLNHGGHAWWNPFSGLGTPVLADGHANNYYLPTMIFRFLNGGYQNLGLLWGLHLLYCFYFLRKLASELGLGFRYSFFPSIIFTFSGYVTAVTSNFPYALGITHTPALFYLLLKVLKSDRKDHAFFFGVLFSQFFMSGYFPFIFNTVVALTFFFVLLAPWKDYQRWLPQLSLSVITAIIFSLPQILPTLQLISESVFSTGVKYDHMISNSLSPRLLLSYLFPAIWGLNDPQNFSYSDNFTDRTQGFFDYDELHNYLGLLPLFFAFLTLRPGWKSPYKKALIGLAGISLLLSLGGHAPFIYKPLSLVAGFNYFKDPAKWSIHLNLGLSILAGFGLQIYLEDKRNLKKTILYSLLFCTPLLIGLGFQNQLMTVHTVSACTKAELSTYLCPLTETVLPMAQTLLACLGSLLVLWLPLSAARKNFIIILLVFTELLLIESPVILRTTEKFFQKPAVIEQLQSADARSVDGVIPKEIDTFGFNHLSGDIGAFYQIPTLTLTSPFVTKAWDDLETWTSERGMIDLQRFSSEESQRKLTPLLASLNVGNILTKDGNLINIPQKLPRAYISYSMVTVKEQDQLNHFLKSCESGKCLEAVVSSTKNESPREIPLTPASIDFLSTEKVTMKVDAVERGILVYTDQYYPGWRVTVNNEPKQLLRVNGLFKGVAIDGPGHYQIEFSFDPPLYVWSTRWFWFCWLFVLPFVCLLRIRYANNNNGRWKR